MIYTITFNPSIDYFVSLDNLTVGQLNRSAVEFFKAGGKGTVSYTHLTLPTT